MFRFFLCIALTVQLLVFCEEEAPFDKDDPFPFSDGYKMTQLSREGQNLMRCLACLDLVKTIMENLQERVNAYGQTRETAVVEAMDAVGVRFGQYYGHTKGLPFQLDGTQISVSTADYNDQIVHILEQNEEKIEAIFYAGDRFPKSAICIDALKVCTARELKVHEDSITKREEERRIKNEKRNKKT